MRVCETNLDEADEDVKMKNQMMIIEKSELNTVAMKAMKKGLMIMTRLGFV